jgi:hypothetical protein
MGSKKKTDQEVNAMNIVFYSNGKDEVLSKRLQKVIERTVPQERLEIFKTNKDFS